MTERCEELVVALSEGTVQQRVQAATEIHALAEMDVDARARFGGGGAIPALVALLQEAVDTGVRSAQEAVTISLLFITLDNDKNRAAVVAAGAVPLFVKLLEQAQSKENDISQLEEFPQARVEASGEGEASGCEGLRVPTSNVEQQLQEKNDRKQRLEQELKQLIEEIQRLAEGGLESLQAVEAASPMAGNEAAMRAAVLALLSLSDLEENNACIGSSGAIPLLLSQLLSTGFKPLYEGALVTLINLALTTPSNGLRMVRAGGIQILMHGLRAKEDMSENILSLLSLLAQTEYGRSIIAETPNALADLVDILDTSSEEEKELVVTTLHLLCTNSVAHTRLVQSEPACGALIEIFMSEMGTPLAKSQAQEILKLFASERRKRNVKSTSHDGEIQDMFAKQKRSTWHFFRTHSPFIGGVDNLSCTFTNILDFGYLDS